MHIFSTSVSSNNTSRFTVIIQIDIPKSILFHGKCFMIPLSSCPADVAPQSCKGKNRQDVRKSHQAHRTECSGLAQERVEVRQQGWHRRCASPMQLPEGFRIVLSILCRAAALVEQSVLDITRPFLYMHPCPLPSRNHRVYSILFSERWILNTHQNPQKKLNILYSRPTTLASFTWTGYLHLL